MAVRTRRLGETSVATAGAGATTTIFTCPADRTAIVKDLRGFCTAGAAGLIFTLSITMASTATRTLFQLTNAAAGPYPLSQLPNAGVTPLGLWIVLQEGDALKIAQPAACTLQTYVSGTLLDGDPA